MQNSFQNEQFYYHKKPTRNSSHWSGRLALTCLGLALFRSHFANRKSGHVWLLQYVTTRQIVSITPHTPPIKVHTCMDVPFSYFLLIPLFFLGVCFTPQFCNETYLFFLSCAHWSGWGYLQSKMATDQNKMDTCAAFLPVFVVRFFWCSETTGELFLSVPSNKHTHTRAHCCVERIFASF